MAIVITGGSGIEGICLVGLIVCAVWWALHRTPAERERERDLAQLRAAANRSTFKWWQFALVMLAFIAWFIWLAS